MTIAGDSGIENVKSKSISGKLLIGITGGVAIGISVICFPFITPAFRKICLPYVPATVCQIENVLNGLRNRSGQLLDIGSGDGRIVISAARKGFVSHGVELNWWLVQYSRFNAILNQVNNKTSFHRCNLWNFHLKPYKNIVIFGVEEMMDKLEDKIKNEVEDGTYIIACRFPFKNFKPDYTIGENIDTVWCYKFRKQN